MKSLLSQYKSLFHQLKLPKMAGGIKIYTDLALIPGKIQDPFSSKKSNECVWLGLEMIRHYSLLS